MDNPTRIELLVGYLDEVYKGKVLTADVPDVDGNRWRASLADKGCILRLELIQDRPNNPAHD